jgi:hypothetical protein
MSGWLVRLLWIDPSVEWRMWFRLGRCVRREIDWWRCIGTGANPRLEQTDRQTQSVRGADACPWSLCLDVLVV